MHPIFAQLKFGVELENDIPSNMASFLAHHGYSKTIEHQILVAEQAVSLARGFEVNAGWVQTAA